MLKILFTIYLTCMHFLYSMGKAYFSDVALWCKTNALYDFNPYFQGLARNLEQPEVKDWLTETKDQLMGEKSGKEKEKEGEKITAILTRWEFKRVFEFFVGYHNIYTSIHYM